jgi:hypothetical protein
MLGAYLDHAWSLERGRFVMPRDFEQGAYWMLGFLLAIYLLLPLLRADG